MISESDPRHGSASSTRGTGRGSHGGHLEAHEYARPVVGTAVSSRGHAAALSDGHVSQDADRLASTRARRAAAARDLRSAGTASPVPTYISSAVSCAYEKVNLLVNPHVVARDLSAAHRPFALPLDADIVAHVMRARVERR